MLPEGAAELVRDAWGEAVLLDARRGRGIVTDARDLLTAGRKLSNGGFTRLIDFTGLHLGSGPDGGDEFALYLILRAPVFGHCGLSLKWKWPPPPAGAVSPAQPVSVRPAELPAAIAGDPELAKLGVARYAIGPAAKTPEDFSGNGDGKPEAAERGLEGRIPGGQNARAPMAGAAPTPPGDKEYNSAGGAGQPGGPPRRAGLVPHPTLSRIWPAAALAEREIFEMLGLPFSDHPGLTPLLLDEQFAGFPLRRDFELPMPADYAGELLKERHQRAMLAALERGEGLR